jgi:hypothetical protein
MKKITAVVLAFGLLAAVGATVPSASFAGPTNCKNADGTKC